MPNHVDCDLTVTGPVETLREFSEFAKEGEKLLSANKFIPYPEEYRKQDKIAEIARKHGNYTIKDGFNSGGYEWCCQNWGTKWGIYDTVELGSTFGKKNGNIQYNCRSAWSPAIPVIIAMSKKFPTLKFKLKYYESGMGFKGIYTVKDGEVLKDEESKYRGYRGG